MKVTSEMLGGAIVNPYDGYMYILNPGVAKAIERGRTFKSRVLSKWAHYQKNYGYKNTKASAKAAAPEISRELLKEFPAKDDLGLRLNDVQGVERLITPLFDMPKLPSASVIIGIIAAIAILPGMLGRYAKARH